MGTSTANPPRWSARVGVCRVGLGRSIVHCDPWADSKLALSANPLNIRDTEKPKIDRRDVGAIFVAVWYEIAALSIHANSKRAVGFPRCVNPFECIFFSEASGSCAALDDSGVGHDELDKSGLAFLGHSVCHFVSPVALCMSTIIGIAA